MSDIMDSLQKGIQGILDDPNLNKLVKDGQKMIENAATTIQTEAAKIVPKTS